jgi:hypothetical protein
LFFFFPADAIARMLQAFDPDTTNFIGIADTTSCRDIQIGLLRRVSIIGFKDEGLFCRALMMPSTQWIELKILNVRT